ncbi:hypothetical protein [Azospirillum thermophilum]|uniref:DUF4136 domain-containing protein n=1 Tax=Azospirillum thermophilum TaxID=2202148 RepID=A0A2S2CRQ8_9PROT|nr:hypothetical protein [Azospirillum thermophilum]AWK87060.1 hypothetical protein DEW08_13225 [Azospirillum thermophilum]
MKRPVPLAVAAAFLLLAGCGNERVVSDLPAPAYTPGELAYAASDRDLRVVIHGNPFGGDGERFGDRVTDYMQNHVFGVRTHFTIRPDQTARPDYRVVLAFNPAQNTLNSELCRNAAIPTRPPGGAIVVQGAFCRGGGALTSATGWLDEVKTMEDPDFRQLIGDLTFSLFPTKRAEADDRLDHPVFRRSRP